MKGHPTDSFEMNTSIATLSVQSGDENSLYLEGKRVKPQCFSCHVDDKNDLEYRDVWVIYKHVQDPIPHLWFHVGNVFSYHKSCGDYMKRLSNGRYLKEWQLGPYLEHYCLQRLSLMIDNFYPIKYKDKLLEPIPRLLFFEDWQWEGAFACTHTLFPACTSWILLLYWLGTCVNFIPNSEGSLALFL
jgi:hypothetical protein